MTIFRIHHKSNYTIIGNDTLRDNRLTFRARGVHHELLSHTGDIQISAREIAKRAIEGRDAILAALNELRDLGYIVTEKILDPDTGRFVMVNHVYETPQAIDSVADEPTPAPENPPPGPENQGPVNQGPVNQDTIERPLRSTNNSLEADASRDDPKPRTARQLIFEALCEIEGINYRDITRAHRSRLNGATKQLVEVEATPDEVRARAAQYRQVMPPGTTLTAMALVANWAKCATTSETRSLCDICGGYAHPRCGEPGCPFETAVDL